MKSVTKVINYLVVALIAVTAIMYYLNVNQPYYKDMNTSLLMMLIMAIILAILPLCLKNESKVMVIVSDICRIAAPILVIYTGVKFLAMRVESFGYIFASNLEAGNEAAMTAAIQAVWLLGLFVLTWILSLIASFFKGNKLL